MSRERLMIFAKAPAPGRVKTRLIPALGAEGAARLHAAFVRDVVARHRRPGRRITLWRAGDLAHPLWAELEVPLATQLGLDLGARLAAAFAVESRGDARVVVLGTDSPTLPPERVDAAFEALQSHRAVVGPAEDGGYYLLGLRGPPPDIFSGIDWGSERVFAQTMAALGDQPSVVLDPWYDVDRPPDLDRLRGSLLPPLPEHTLRALDG